MDREHLNLIARVNEFSDAVDAGASRAELETRLTLLTESFRSHFNSEERLMQAAGFPGLKVHADEHRKLIEQINELRAGLGSGSISLCYSLILFVQLWTNQHVTGKDMDFKHFLRQNCFTAPPPMMSGNTCAHPA